jgi:hypothetical protein
MANESGWEGQRLRHVRQGGPKQFGKIELS